MTDYDADNRYRASGRPHSFRLAKRIPFESHASGVGEIVGTFLGCEAAEYVVEGIPSRGDGSVCDFAQ
jgi:hypothetical protein